MSIGAAVFVVCARLGYRERRLARHRTLALAMSTLSNLFGVRNGGGLAWVVAAGAIGAYYGYPAYEKWNHEKQLNEKFAIGERLMQSGTETGERYRQFVKEKKDKASKRGWFGSK